MRSRCSYSAAGMAAVVLFVAPAARAQVFVGDTTTSPVWNRPAIGGGLSGIMVPYEEFQFHVSVSDTYSLTASPQSSFDLVEFLYQDEFSAATPLVGLLAGRDVGGPGAAEVLSRSLATGRTYYAVTTGFGASDAGPYTLAFAGIGVAVPGPAPTFGGDTTDAPTWNRPNLNGTSLSGLNVPFSQHTFHVTRNGNYTITAQPHSNFDMVQFLYRDPFDSVTPLDGFLAGADGGAQGGAESLSFSLTAGVTYHAVTTGFGASDFGPFSLSFAGLGESVPGATDLIGLDTAGNPTWNRPNVNGTSLSGQVVPFETYGFRVSQTGNYAITANPQAANFDLAAYVYDQSFTAAAPLVGFLNGADGNSDGGAESLSLLLSAGQTYYAVVSGFAPSDFGPFTLYFSGPGLVTPLGVPGDYNDNGTVDAADYVVWRKNQGTANALPNDAIGGTIGPAHYEQWRAHFGRTAVALSPPGPAGVHALVPEPATSGLALLGAVAMITIRRTVVKLTSGEHS